jgi:hypothetical protein
VGDELAVGSRSQKRLAAYRAGSYHGFL